MNMKLNKKITTLLCLFTMHIHGHDLHSDNHDTKKLIHIVPGGTYYFNVYSSKNKPIFVHMQNEQYIQKIYCKKINSEPSEYACEITVSPLIESPKPECIGVFRTPEDKNDKNNEIQEIFEPLFYLDISPKIKD